MVSSWPLHSQLWSLWATQRCLRESAGKPTHSFELATAGTHTLIVLQQHEERGSNLDRWDSQCGPVIQLSTWMEWQETTFLPTLALSTEFSRPVLYVSQSYPPFSPNPLLSLIFCEDDTAYSHPFPSFPRTPTASVVSIRVYTWVSPWAPTTMERRSGIRSWGQGEAALPALAFLPLDFLSHEKTQLLSCFRFVLWVFCYRKLNLTFFVRKTQQVVFVESQRVGHDLVTKQQYSWWPEFRQTIP